MSVRALVVSGLACTALLAGVGGAGSYAFWTDAQQVEGVDLSAGSLDLQVEGSSATYTWTALGRTQLAPGESVSASVVLSNAGSTPFTMSVQGSATGDLSPHALVTVKTGATASADDTTYPRVETCDGGTQHFASTLGATATLADLTAMSPGATRVLCVMVALPTSALNAAQGKSMVPTFTITAQQVLS